MIIPVALLCLFCSVHGFNLCANSGARFVLIDGCLSKPTVKPAWLYCLDKVTGSRNPSKAAQVYCADPKKRDEMSEKVSLKAQI